MEENKDKDLELEGQHEAQESGVRIQQGDGFRVIPLKGLIDNWFIDYASSVILDRAVPEINDGFKPVQRRILHSMKELEDGRYNKVANIVGNTMKYHPHGDASIGDALVNLGQKDLLIDTQGNWGNVLTGDPAAAPRYIEARLSKFALDVVYNPKTTEWKFSYDGRNKEPVTLPVKFPLLLAQGAIGIAVGLKVEILPHNFNELIDASIAYLRDEPFELYPDFRTGGMIDVRSYNDGARGCKVQVRAKISQLDKKTLVITEIPYGTTTGTLIDSITKAGEKGQIKIRRVDDNTSRNAEIVIHLASGVSPDQTIDALYAFTLCQVSLNSLCTCVIRNEHPEFTTISAILRESTDRTLDLLSWELKIKLDELERDWHLISLEKIFFEKRIYKILEKDADSWEDQVTEIERAFDPYRQLLKTEITRDDVLRLCEKPVRKISKFDIKKAEDQILDIESQIEKFQSGYYDAISKCHIDGTSTVFIEFILEQINTILDEVGSSITSPGSNISEYVTKLLNVMEFDTPYTANEILSLLGLKSKETLRKNYLNPAISDGFVIMTQPDKPNSRNQRYIKK